MIRKSLIFILLQIIVVTYASAQIVVSAPQVQLVSCNAFSYDLTITNTGTQVEPITVLAQGTPAEWFTFEPNQDLLTPQETLQVNVFGRVPCQTEGSYTATFLVEGSETQRLRQPIEVVRQNNIGISAVAAQQSCPCLPHNYPITITNTGQNPEVYNFEIQSDNAQIVPERMIVFPGQSSTATAYIYAPCSFAGDITADVTVTSEFAGFQTTFPITSTYLACYDYELSAQQVDVCLDGDSEIYVNLENQMYFQNSYTFSSPVPWLTPQFAEVTLPPQTDVQVPLLVQPRSGLFGVQPDLYEVFIEATSVAGSAKSTLGVPINIQQCYDLQIETPRAVGLCPGDTEIPITIFNNGVVNVTTVFGLEGPEFVTLTPSLVELAPLVAQNVTLQLQGDEIAEGVYPVAIIAQVQDNELTTIVEEIDLFIASQESCFEVSFEPNRIQLENGNTTATINITHRGFKPEQYALGVNASQPLSVTPANIDLQPGQSQAITLITTADVDFEAILTAQTESFAYEGIISFSRVNIWLALPLLFILVLLYILVIIFVNPVLGPRAKKRETKQKSKKEKLSKEEKQNAKLDKKAAKKQKKEDKKKEKLAKKLAKKEAKDKKKQRKLDKKSLKKELKEGRKNAKRQAKEDKKLAKIERKELKLQAKQERKEKKREDKRRKKQEGGSDWIKYLLFLILLILLLLFLFSPQSEEQTSTNSTNETEIVLVNESLTNFTSPLTQQQINILLIKEYVDAIPDDIKDTFVYQFIDQGQSTTIDLAELFTDPDDDDLQFNALEADGIDISIEDGVVSIVPEEDFFGIRYTIFFAEDSQGQTAQSPIVNIVVLPVNLTEQVAEIQEEQGTLEDIELLFEPQQAVLERQEQDKQTLAWTLIIATWLAIAFGLYVVYLITSLSK